MLHIEKYNNTIMINNDIEEIIIDELNKIIGQHRESRESKI